MVVKVAPGYFGGNAKWSGCIVSSGIGARESRFVGEELDAMSSGIGGKLFSNSWIDGSLVASEDVRREVDGDMHPSSPIDVPICQTWNAYNQSST